MKKIYVLKNDTYNVWDVKEMLDDLMVESIIFGNPKWNSINEYKVNQLYSLMDDYMITYREENVECDKNIKEFFKCENDYQINEIRKAIDSYRFSSLTDKISFVISMLNATTNQKWVYITIDGVTFAEHNHLICPSTYDKELITQIQDLYFNNVESYQAKVEDDSKTANQIAKSIQKDSTPFIVGCNTYNNIEELKKSIKSCFGDYEVVFLQVKDVKIIKKYTYDFC